MSDHYGTVGPVIYWITVGDTAAVNGLEWKLAQLKYGLTGKVRTAFPASGTKRRHTPFRRIHDLSSIFD